MSRKKVLKVIFLFTCKFENLPSEEAKKFVSYFGNFNGDPGGPDPKMEFSTLFFYFCEKK